MMVVFDIQRIIIRFRYLLTYVMLPTLVLGALRVEADSGIEVGQPFPDLVLPSINDGQPMSITDFRGQKIVLHVFASW